MMASKTTLARALQDAEQGRMGAALATLRVAVNRDPKDYEAVQIFGMLLLWSGELTQALHHFGRCVTAAPGVVAFRNNYANALMNADRVADAVTQLRAAIEIDPSYAMAYLGLTIACAQVGDSVAGIAAGRRGLVLKPDWPELSRNLASVLKDAGQIDEALFEFNRAIAKHPRDAGLRSGFLWALNYSDEPVSFAANAHREYAQCVRKSCAAARTDPAPDRPLRIGVLSGDFRTHSVAFFAEPFIRDAPTDCVLTLFSDGKPDPRDAMRTRFIELAREWIDVGALGDEALDAAIRSRKIDVLVELGGHSSGGRLGALDNAPAPVIVSAIGYPNTTGHPAVGWRIVDSITDPIGSDAHCTEQLARIDPCFLCYCPPAQSPQPALPSEEAPITFGSFNMTPKISPRTIALWSATLKAVPGSRLLLKSKSMADAGTRAHMLALLERGGISPACVDVVAYTAGLQEHLALYARVHVALDTTPYNGTTTTCEALWMGVPTLTLLGDRHAARVSASLLTAAGHEELIAHTQLEFVDKARALATDRPRLTTLRSTLRDDLLGSALCDQHAYAQRFHAALRTAWRTWCAAVCAYPAETAIAAPSVGGVSN
ncbi:MAG: tetratricopeptide repeat protein [Phycisphaerales bacterium]|nr:tetratricopeptide repeat protein [Phycisphaerales bacterium]